MKFLNNVFLFMCAVTWPIALFLANTPNDFVRYIVPTILLAVSYYLFKKSAKYYLIPIIAIPVFEPKIAIYPIVFIVLDYVLLEKKTIKLLYFLVAIFALLVTFKSFYGQTILVADYEARQQVIRDSNLYPNSIFARTFHNKAKIHTDLFIKNFFVLIDPNNYFFGSAPRQNVTNQNLTKFPFIAIVPFLMGIFYFQRRPKDKFVLASALTGLLCLSFLKIFDRQDFILWLPIFLTIASGLTYLKLKNNISVVLAFIFLVLTTIEILRVVVLA